MGALGTAEIFLSPASGYSVTLNGFSLGAYPNASRSSQYAILGGDGTPLVSSGPITVLGSTPTQVSLVETRSDGIRILWGPDAYNVAIDDIDFTVSSGPIPEPATPALIALGLTGLAWRDFRRA
ncbi:MAG: PEP-CTERM sorting domain-containing protein [Myxococcota bacterium]